MGWFSKLFSKKQKNLEKVELSLDSVDGWLDSKAELSKEELKQKFQDIKDQLNLLVSEAEKDIEALEKAELRNSKIDTKMIHIMEGNRKTYVNFGRSFIDRIKFPEFSKVNAFYRDFKEDLESFNKTTTKAYYIMQEFFKNESHKVAGDIKKVADLIEEMKNAYDNSPFSKFQAIKDEAEKVIEKKALKAELKQEINKLREESSEMKNKLSQHESTLEDAKQSKPYKELMELKERLNKVDMKIAEHKNSLFKHFSALERPLKKYKHMSYDYGKLVESYLDNPVNALVKDGSLEVINMMESVKRLINAGEIELKTQDKAVDIIDKLDKKYFDNFRKIYDSLKKEKQNAEFRISESSVERQISDINNKIEAQKHRVERCILAVETAEQKYKKIDIKALTAHLKSKLIDAGYDVKFTE